MKYLQANKDASAGDIAKMFKVTPTHVYVIRNKLKSAATTAKPKVEVHFSTSNKSVVDLVNQPPHYKVGGIETIDFIEAKELNYRLGNVVKYVTRANHKGDRLDNLKKAQWYLNREIAKEELSK